MPAGGPLPQPAARWWSPSPNHHHSQSCFGSGSRWSGASASCSTGGSVQSVNQQVLGLAEDANTHTPLGEGDERIVRDRFVLWMGPGDEPHWNVAQRLRMRADEVDEVRGEVHALLRARGRGGCTWEIGSSATPPNRVPLLLPRGRRPDEPDPLQLGMALDTAPPGIPPAISVRRVES